MAIVPTFETVAIVGDKPTLVAELASLFTRAGRYLAVMDGPRMSRPDASNEVIRRTNALVKVRPRRILLAELPQSAMQAMSVGWSPEMAVSVSTVEAAGQALKGLTNVPSEKMPWCDNNLGVGLLLARRAKKQLQTSIKPSSNTTFVPGSRSLLVVCEDGEELAQISASCFAFATGGAFLVIPHLMPDERDEWLEELYALESGGDVSSRFANIRGRVRARLPTFEFGNYKQVLFVTSGFPWGIAVNECATTHMYNYPDFGRSMVEGLCAAQNASRSARNALLIDPAKVEGSEIQAIAKTLANNGTLVRVQAGPRATAHRIQTLIDTLPFDIIVLSTHAGDAPGERATYEYIDSEGLNRRLVIDHARSISYDPGTGKFVVQEYERFHELDGVDWSDARAKAKLHVGTAISSWSMIGDMAERNKYKVASATIQRVIGSMALQMHDHIWIPMIQGFPPSAAPFVLNNACLSWHELSQRFMFAGARAYIGTLFPVMDAEAQEVGKRIFRDQIGVFLPIALWATQKAVYRNQGRWPYVMVGLPFGIVRPNIVQSVGYMAQEYMLAIAEYDAKYMNSPFADTRENAARYRDFLRDDFASFTQNIEKTKR